ncbi:hypothetical protein GJ688_06175 [Heliobacillus mobilis]|uniref:Uncharacterized protein n=1 Tax=Heliobacterium mobile TaxID=28064 RepID=A0A6I3SI89_HELMO|nr:hypothetical protein [Heliobacterium mobile]MTV48568.1 hypothetical protein [Heliobacterium mobile]
MKGIQGDPHTTNTVQAESHSNVQAKKNMKTVQLTPDSKVSVPANSPVKDLPQ